VNRRMSIYLSTRTGNLPRGRTAPQVGLGHEPLKRSVPYYSDNRAVLSPTLTVPILFTGRSTPNYLLIPQFKMALSMGKDATNGIHCTQGHLLYTYLHTQHKQGSNAIYRQEIENVTTDYKQGCMYSTVTYTVTLGD